MESSGIGFLPFVDYDVPFFDSLNLMEILHSVCDEEDFQRALELLVVSTFERHYATNALLISPGNKLDDKRWTVTHQYNLGSIGPENKVFSLNPNHKIVKLIERARVTRAYSNGKETAAGPIISSSSNQKMVEFNETHEIICIPLIRNLEVRAGLIIVLGKQIEISGSDRSLMAGLQAIFSFFYFKQRWEPSPDLDENELSFGLLATNHLTYGQKRIARLLIEGRKDEDILVELDMSIEEFEKHYVTIASYVFAQSREEVIQELKLMDLT